MPTLIERRGMTVRRLRFNELNIGGSYLEADSSAGPFVKADHNNRWTTTARNSLTRVSTGTRVIDLTPPGMFPLPLINHNLFYSSSPGPGAFFGGSDPVLGPPFPPVFYQLFIEQPGTFANTPGTGNGVNLFWDIPQVNFGIQEILSVFLVAKCRVWFGLVNDITQATGFVDIPGNFSGRQYIHPSAYVWAATFTNNDTTAPSPPAVAGVLIGTGTGTTGQAFNGEIDLHSDITPSGGGTITFRSVAAQTITSFSLARSRGTPTFTDATNNVIPLSIGVGTTTSFGFNTPPVNGNINDGSGSLRVVDSSLLATNQLVWITTAGLYRVNYAIDGTHVSITSVASSNNVAAQTPILSGQRVAPIQSAYDDAARDANTNYFYQLRGHLSAGGLITFFPYNNVGLVRPYPAPTIQQLTDVPPYNINPSGDHKYNHLTWDAPTAAEVAGWPSTSP